MIILSAKDLTKSFGADTIFNGIAFALQEGQRVGLVGANGSGKSTIFRILTGECGYDAGTVYTARGLKISCLKQVESDFDGNVYEYLNRAFAHIDAMEKELADVERRMNEGVPGQILLDRHAALLEQMSDSGAFAREGRIKSALLGLGFGEGDFALPLGALSGGQHTRMALARLLLEDAQLLLLDEPTNHLDIASVEWLEDFLRSCRKTVLVISHDRYFLDRVTDTTWELDDTLTEYNGSYSAYAAQKEINREVLEHAYKDQQKEIARLEKSIELQRSFNREKSIRKAESMEKRLEKIERVERPGRETAAKIRLTPNRVSGERVLEAEGLRKAYDRKILFKDTDITVMRGERAFLIGGNGTGKTTLFKGLLKQAELDGGYFRFGAKVDIGYYDQAHMDLSNEKTVIDEVWDAYPSLTQTEIRSALGAMLFSGEDVFKPVSALSGGERAKVSLLKLMLSGANLLMLDEPTNHLDISGCEALENALSGYKGTLFCISHDRYFINKLADHIYYISPSGAVEEYVGDYDYFVEKHTQTDVQKTRPREKSDYHLEKARQSEIRRREGRLARVQSAIDQKEALISELEAESVLHGADYEKLLEITERVRTLRIETDALYEEYITLSDM